MHRPNKRAPFIVIYGPPNIGKSTQVPFVVAGIVTTGLVVKARSMKYPVYNHEPTGPELYRELRSHQTLSDYELQLLAVQNRKDYEPFLVEDLEDGVGVVSEDYTKTGIVWGTTHGIPLEEMERINEGLLVEDLAILLDGERFASGGAIERGHRYEDSGKWEAARSVHLELAERYGWEVVNANQNREKVTEDILKIITEKFE